MTTLKLLTTAIVSAVVTAPLAIWLTNTPPLQKELTIPPLLFSEDNGELVIWGAWSTIEGYKHPSTVATEIRCSKELMTCTEGLGMLLLHDYGQDLEAQTFTYQINDWSSEAISAIAKNLMVECLQRMLSIDLSRQAAVLSWAPTSTCDDGDTGKAILIGDEVDNRG
ncbi:hypothetical protein [Pseudomonas benzenivorans]|uniref:Uncharacterized protein n=1 Tax=Pseudomonas benzenivorans TaxID=556533 RepID=A0ABY5H447_9PSED|nr:hypothetical protein [Pseudomonas benzenivorans]UTW07000.1 hypothetical protein KDW96_17815 [Pseudomonas benzenivorans]UTW09419.1 hypothetical protein KDW96_09010 [Pseudomonas benzenivorans]